MDVRYLHSGMRGAPGLIGTAGTNSLIAVLTACLETGFGLTTAISVNVADGIATAVLPSGETFEVSSIVEISGAAPAALNGDARVLSLSGSTITWATDAPDGAASGTIQIRYAPIRGWERQFLDGSVAAFRMTSVESSGCVLRVDDSPIQASRVVGYASMANASDGTEPFPTNVQFAGGAYWPRSSSNNSTQVLWSILGDSRGFHYRVANHYSVSSSYGGFGKYWFGDMRTRKMTDAYPCALLASSHGTNSNDGVSVSRLAGSQFWAQRSYTGLGSSVALGRSSFGPQGPTNGEGIQSGGQASYPGYPNLGEELILSPLHVIEGSSWVAAAQFRGFLPGVYHIPLYVAPGAFTGPSIVDGQGELLGRRLLIDPGYGVSTALPSIAGATVYDIDGPWR